MLLRKNSLRSQLRYVDQLEGKEIRKKYVVMTCEYRCLTAKTLDEKPRSRKISS